MLIERTFSAQLILVLFRPFAFIWSVPVIASVTWGSSYLVALGLIPLFSILDSLFQAHARHGYLTGFIARPNKKFFVHLGYLIVGILMLTIGYGFRIESYYVMAAAIFALYTLSAVLNIYEDTFASTEATFNIAMYEITAFLICSFVALLHQSLIAAVAVHIINPLCRVLVALRYSASPRRMGARIVGIEAKISYIIKNIFTQLFASMAAAAPAIIVFFSITPKEHISNSLIYFKVLFVSSSILSLAINLLSSRLFYGVINLNLRRYERKLQIAERVYIVFFVITAALLLISLFCGYRTKIFLTLFLCVAFSYLNLLSSLGLARGRPGLSVITQGAILVGSVGFAIFLGGLIVKSFLPMLAFAFIFLLIHCRHKVSGLLMT